jgi:hypothetical protein
MKKAAVSNKSLWKRKKTEKNMEQNREDWWKWRYLRQWIVGINLNASPRYIFQLQKFGWNAAFYGDWLNESCAGVEMDNYEGNTFCDKSITQECSKDHKFP